MLRSMLQQLAEEF